MAERRGKMHSQGVPGHGHRRHPGEEGPCAEGGKDRQGKALDLCLFAHVRGVNVCVMRLRGWGRQRACLPESRHPFDLTRRNILFQQFA